MSQNFNLPSKDIFFSTTNQIAEENWNSEKVKKNKKSIHALNT